jgi:2-dehydropantoate 2-reductase
MRACSLFASLVTESVLHRVAIVGAGALGSLLGARLAQAGCEVLLIAREPQAQAIARAGLQLRTPAGQALVKVQAATDMAAVQAYERVVVCVKSADTENVALQLRTHLHGNARVLSLQNGVDNGATLARVLPQRVAAGLAYVAAALPEPGVVLHSGGNRLVLGGVRCPPAELQAWAALLQAAGFDAEITPDLDLALWNKLIVNCVFNAISALTQSNYGLMAAVPEVRELQQAVLHECVAVAQAGGVAVSLPALQQAVEAVALNMPQQRSSTAQDLARGKPTEVAHLNGHIVRRGLALGIATPANQALLALVLLATSNATKASLNCT